MEIARSRAIPAEAMQPNRGKSGIFAPDTRPGDSRLESASDLEKRVFKFKSRTADTTYQSSERSFVRGKNEQLIDA